MIYLYYTETTYLNNKLNIDYLLENFNYIKFIIIEYENDFYEYIVKNQLLYSNNIIIDEINEILLTRLSSINYCDNCFLLNTKILNESDNIDYIKNFNVKIFDFNKNNIKLTLKYKNFIQLFNTKINNIENLFNSDNKNDNISILNNESNLKNQFLDKFMLNNIDIYEYDIDDNKINENKILLIFNEDITEEFIAKAIINKTIILHCKSDSCINENINKYNLLNKYSININIDIIQVFILFIIKNYQQIINILYKNINIEDIIKNINKEKCEMEKNNNENIFNEMNIKDNYGFIMVRHVNSEKTNNYWIECYNSIRKFYSNKIVIIDDNSDYNYIKIDDKINIYNVEFVQSKYHARGEILGYYYFYKKHFFDKAVIIHDSVFIKKYIDFNKYEHVRFIWHFTSPWFDETAEKNMLLLLNNKEELQQYYYKRDLIHGCFGVQSVITYNFLSHLENKYDFFELIRFITNRTERMNLERIFALMCIHEYSNLSKEPSIFGAIHDYTRFGYSYEDYLKDLKNNNLKDKEIIKVWTGR